MDESNIRVPQGTILGPILFLIYINDFLNGISSPTKLFADDTKVYRGLIDLEKDKQILQSDLDRMTKWTNTWQLNFNSDKCEVMRITHQKDFSLPDYNLSGKKLKVVNEFKDLGVIMTSNLSWSNQVASSVKKANRILGLIKRMVGSFTPTSTFTTLYKSLVRPLLVYAAPVWSPHLVKDIQALEAVQRRASRPALKQRRGEMPYKDRCELLKWNTLEK